MRTPLDRPGRQQHSYQPGNTIIVQRRRRSSPRKDWTGSTFVKMVELAGLEPATSWVRSGLAGTPRSW
jgi:hypothetical protein